MIDICGLLLGLLYLWLEYKADIRLWVVSVIMPIVHGYLYFASGLYADFAMQFYYVAAAIYGLVIWRTGRSADNKQEKPITHFPVRRIAPCVVVFAILWVAIYLLLSRFTDSTVPVLDSFTTALSMLALWALAQKYAEQWLLWLVVDVVCCGLYIYKQIPFTATLYGFYSVVAVLGYRKWLHLIKS